jgi:HAD superfamily hydrolase (TIGR01549 family)
MSSARAIIFDMDGTLTLPTLDFDLIREEIGVRDEPILEAVQRMSPSDRARAESILKRHEDVAAAVSELQPGAMEVVSTIRSAGWAVALMTRNTRESVRAFQQRHGIDFDLIRTREDGPMKPSPQPVFEICQRLRVAPADSWVVGDFHFDILCGKAARATTVLLLDRNEPRPAWADESDHVIHQLPELIGLVGISAALPKPC